MAQEWLVDVKACFHNQDLVNELTFQSVCIYKVPTFLFQLNQSAYVPQCVSLGPIHHTNAALAEKPSMLSKKVHATHKMFQRLQAVSPTKVEFEGDVIGRILDLLPTVRKCYQKQIHLDDISLAWMLTLDACFILEILRALNGSTNSYHGFFHRNTIEYTAYPIISDMLMLENQIPFFVLLKILELELQTDEENACRELCVLLNGARITRLFYPFNETASWLPQGIPHGQKVKHLLDLFRMLVIYSSFPDRKTVWKFNCSMSPHKQEYIIPSASELRRAGIKFRKVDGKFEEIGIKNNIFHLPRIRISRSIETVLRNLMALEICEAEDTCVISRYVLLMCELIDSEKDVSVLKKAGIIKSYMGSDREVALLFNGLSKGITRSYGDPFAKVREDAHKHYHSKIKVIVAEFANSHCSSPWRTMSLIGACLILLLAAVQTIFSLHHKLLVN
ncbi:hypothetical protein SUGI_0727080 [Cryptomeria japonica]|uniref:putative UPF0481 protein At3g02645 n=1 Tax=Cryptomeria japonica TaxID=3369 RepID=UPI0024149831|nr:putative UPF0481 protein At3g02645 [Cryptomeria japonica]GLJ36218.1 hypothetical protein SUGI_0727080 [Cryptomeria japonica]